MRRLRATAKTAFLSCFNASARLVIERLPLRRSLSVDNFVRLAYRLLLDRPADPAGFEHHRRHILEQGLDKSFVFQALATSPEYEKGLDARHHARRLLVARLPAAEVIVDLGGSSPHADAGALHAMGYPHRWRRLVIVDLPPAERYVEWRKAGGEAARLDTDRGPVEYVYGSIADPGVIAGEGFADLVWSGNSIEHVTEEEGDRVLELARRVLKPGGLLYYTLPDMRYTFDKPRGMTTFEHLVRDDREGPLSSRAEHYREWAEKVLHKEDPEAEAAKLMETMHDMHFHTWTCHSLSDMLSKIRAYFDDSLELLAFHRNTFDGENEMVIILQKQASSASEKKQL